jgi:nitrate/TMAO reductase-like tetraheme cytochrome c subunit
VIVAERVRSFWRHWWGKLVFAVAALILLGIASTAVAAQFTESNKFCGSDCHEMWAYRDTWAISTHKGVNCVQCHIAPGFISLVETKFFAMREVWVHVTGQVKAPIKVTRHIPNGACERGGCHTRSQISVPNSLGSPAPVTFSHTSSGHGRLLCISCHASLVHAGAPAVTSPPAISMASCFTCHPDGTKTCTYCHSGPHDSRGPCQNCHNLWAWVGGKNFAHPQPLVGTHAATPCETCHTQGVSVKPDGCITCHGDQHNGLRLCDTCHVLAAWIPSTFKHPQEGPHVPNGDERLQCSACHATGFGQKASCPCHGGSAPTGGG